MHLNFILEVARLILMHGVTILLAYWQARVLVRKCRDIGLPHCLYIDCIDNGGRVLDPVDILMVGANNHIYFKGGATNRFFIFIRYEVCTCVIRNQGDFPLNLSINKNLCSNHDYNLLHPSHMNGSIYPTIAWWLRTACHLLSLLRQRIPKEHVLPSVAEHKKFETKTVSHA